MRATLTIGLQLILGSFAVCSAGEPAPKLSDAAAADVHSLLKTAREIALLQEENQNFWTERVVCQVANLQARGQDLEGAVATVRNLKNNYQANALIVKFARLTAQQGKRERAIEILKLLDPKHGWSEDHLSDSIQLSWIEALISNDQLEQAAKACESLQVGSWRARGYRAVALAYVKACNQDAVKTYLKLTLAIPADEDSRYAISQVFSDVAAAQKTASSPEAAKATLLQLCDTCEKFDPWIKIISLKEAAVITAKLGDTNGAKKLFQCAIDAQKDVDDRNKLNALERIALSQVEAGLFDEAKKLSQHNGIDERGRIHVAIALAQIHANDLAAAMQTWKTAKDNRQNSDDVLEQLITALTEKQQFIEAAKLADSMRDWSLKVVTKLKIATSCAKQGNRQMADQVAKTIELTSAEGGTIRLKKAIPFDYKNPTTWGINYGHGAAYSTSSYLTSVLKTADVAYAAMTLAQTLELKPTEPYADSFEEVINSEIIQALARAHAAHGDVQEAISWAKQIGSDAKIQEDDSKTRWAVTQRIHALMGVAEGILDRAQMPNHEERD